MVFHYGRIIAVTQNTTSSSCSIGSSGNLCGGGMGQANFEVNVPYWKAINLELPKSDNMSVT